MANNEEVLREMASVKGDVRKRVEATITAILDLAWAYRSSGFAFDADDTLDEEVNRLLVLLSNGNLVDAEFRARRLLQRLQMEGYSDDSLVYAEGEIDGEDIIFRYDMHSSHLKELIALWIGIAAIYGYSAQEVKAQILTYGGMPFLSPLWKEGRRPVFSWGRGYDRNIVNGITVIGQDFINRSFQYATIQRFKDQGAIGYRTVRNSNYHCPYCDEMATKIWPLDEVRLPYHTRCVCYAVPVFANEL